MMGLLFHREDWLGGYGMMDLGWCHPEVVEAVIAQVRRSPMPSQELIDPLRGVLARLMAEITPAIGTAALVTLVLGAVGLYGVMAYVISLRTRELAVRFKVAPGTDLADIKRGIEANALYIIPYPETKDMLAAHFAAIVDSVPGIETDPEGARKRTDALMDWGANGAQVFVKGKA